MATKKQEMSLEEFEQGATTRRRGGFWAMFIRELQPRTPTIVPMREGASAGSVRPSLSYAWRSVMREERGGHLSTTSRDNVVWVVWYPEEKSGS